MRGWLILSFTFAIGIVLGVGAMTKGPALVAPYLPKSISGQSERIDGEVVRKQREGNRLLVKVATAQGPMLVTFTQKVVSRGCLPWSYVRFARSQRPFQSGVFSEHSCVATAASATRPAFRSSRILCGRHCGSSAEPQDAVRLQPSASA